jgi:hypothetical protein
MLSRSVNPLARYVESDAAMDSLELCLYTPWR